MRPRARRLRASTGWPPSSKLKRRGLCPRPDRAGATLNPVANRTATILITPTSAWLLRRSISYCRRQSWLEPVPLPARLARAAAGARLVRTIARVPIARTNVWPSPKRMDFWARRSYATLRKAEKCWNAGAAARAAAAQNSSAVRIATMPRISTSALISESGPGF